MCGSSRAREHLQTRSGEGPCTLYLPVHDFAPAPSGGPIAPDLSSVGPCKRFQEQQGRRGGGSPLGRPRRRRPPPLHRSRRLPPPRAHPCGPAAPAGPASCGPCCCQGLLRCPHMSNTGPHPPQLARLCARKQRQRGAGSTFGFRRAARDAPPGRILGRRWTTARLMWGHPQGCQAAALMLGVASTGAAGGACSMRWAAARPLDVPAADQPHCSTPHRTQARMISSAAWPPSSSSCCLHARNAGSPPTQHQECAQHSAAASLQSCSAPGAAMGHLACRRLPPP